MPRDIANVSASVNDGAPSFARIALECTSSVPVVILSLLAAFVRFQPCDARVARCAPSASNRSLHETIADKASARLPPRNPSQPQSSQGLRSYKACHPRRAESNLHSRRCTKRGDLPQARLDAALGPRPPRSTGRAAVLHAAYARNPGTASAPINRLHQPARRVRGFFVTIS